LVHYVVRAIKQVTKRENEEEIKYDYPNKCNENLKKYIMNRYWTTIFNIVCKGKSVPLQARGAQRVPRSLRFQDCVTMVQNGGKVVSLTHRSFSPPGNTPGTNFC